MVREELIIALGQLIESQKEEFTSLAHDRIQAEENNANNNVSQTDSYNIFVKWYEEGLQLLNCMLRWMALSSMSSSCAEAVEMEIENGNADAIMPTRSGQHMFAFAAPSLTPYLCSRSR